MGLKVKVTCIQVCECSNGGSIRFDGVCQGSRAIYLQMTIICNLRLFLAHFLPFMLPVASDIDVKNVFLRFVFLFFIQRLQTFFYSSQVFFRF